MNGRFAPVCLLVSVSVCVAMRFAHRGASRQAMRFAHRGPSRQEGVCYGYSQCEVVFAGWAVGGDSEAILRQITSLKQRAFGAAPAAAGGSVRNAGA